MRRSRGGRVRSIDLLEEGACVHVLGAVPTQHDEVQRPPGGANDRAVLQDERGAPAAAFALVALAAVRRERVFGPAARRAPPPALHAELREPRHASNTVSRRGRIRCPRIAFLGHQLGQEARRPLAFAACDARILGTRHASQRRSGVTSRAWRCRRGSGAAVQTRAWAGHHRWVADRAAARQHDP